MPTYEYLCDKCGYKFEKYHQMLHRLKICPECNNPTLIRLVGCGSGIIFKGDGWTLPSKETKGGEE